MVLAQLIDEVFLDTQRIKQLRNYFWMHHEEIANGPRNPYVDDLTEDMEALLLNLSFQILGVEDLPLTVKVLLRYHRLPSPEESKQPFLVKR